MNKEIKKLLKERLELSEDLKHYLIIESFSKVKIIENQIKSIDRLIKILNK